MHQPLNVDKKIAFMVGFQKILEDIPKDKCDEFEDKWIGQRCLIVLNLARELSKDKSFTEGLKSFKIMASYSISSHAITKLDVSKSKQEYRIAIILLKLKTYGFFYVHLAYAKTWYKYGNDVMAL